MCAGAHLVTVVTDNWYSSVLKQLQSCHRVKNNRTFLKYIRPTSNVVHRNDFMEINDAVLIFILLQMRKGRGIA